MSTKMSQEKFVQRVGDIWGDQVDVSQAIYVNKKTPITAVCVKHGEFSQKPQYLLAGAVGCSKCKGEKYSARQVLTQEQFLEKAQEVWGDRWDYSETEYTAWAGTITVICREHGPYNQRVAVHMRGGLGCKECFKLSNEKTHEDFLSKAVPKWGDRWDYSKVKSFSRWDDKVVIGCREHGRWFDQVAYNHVTGSVGCADCVRESKARKMSTTPQDFLEVIHKVWGERWDFTETQYTNSSTRVTARCRDHGNFQQLPYEMSVGAVGCRQCYVQSRQGVGLFSSQDFIDRSFDIWGDRWDYSLTEYQGANIPVKIRCKKHNIAFTQRPINHWSGQVACPSCRKQGTSKAEKEMHQVILEASPEARSQVTRLMSNGRWEIDSYVPSQRVGFEFNGLFWHSEFKKDNDYHYRKFKAAQDAGIRLYQIWEDDWNLRQDLVKRHIRQVLGVSDLPKVSARQTEVVALNASEVRPFLEENHIQGFVNSSVYLGLKYQDVLVAVATFKRSGEDYVLTRYATSAQVRGGHSKLVSYFEKNHSYGKLVTFADLTFGSGGLYRTTGWVEDKVLPPDYSYLVDGERVHKFRYRLKRFREDPELVFEEGKTERELALLNGLYRVYDAGKIRFIKPHPKFG